MRKIIFHSFNQTLGRAPTLDPTESGNSNQQEHMEVARACAEVIAKIFPMTSDLVTND